MFQMIDRPFTVSFFGHRYVEDFSEVERTVERILSELFQRNEMIELLVGKDGEFDQIVSSSIKRAKNNMVITTARMCGYCHILLPN